MRDQVAGFTVTPCTVDWPNLEWPVSRNCRTGQWHRWPVSNHGNTSPWQDGNCTGCQWPVTSNTNVFVWLTKQWMESGQATWETCWCHKSQAECWDLAIINRWPGKNSDGSLQVEEDQRSYPRHTGIAWHRASGTEQNWVLLAVSSRRGCLSEWG